MKNKTLISDLRKQKGLTQERLSELTGLNVYEYTLIKKIDKQTFHIFVYLF